MISSDSTRVPPVTAERSPPDSRITGADSPVIADSSTEAIPSITVPSPGISSPALTTTTSPLMQLGGGLRRCRRAAARRSRVRIERKRVGLGAAATLGERLGEVREHDRQPQPDGDRDRVPGRLSAGQEMAAEHLDDPDRRADRGAELDHEHHRVAHLDARVELDEAVDQGMPGDLAREQRRFAVAGSAGRWTPAGSRSRSRSCGSFAGDAVERQVELEHVDRRFAGEAEARDRRCTSRSGRRRWPATDGAPRRSGAPGSRRWPARCPGSSPDALVSTASTGTFETVRPGSYLVVELEIGGDVGFDRLLGRHVVGAEVGERRGGGVVGRDRARRPRLEVARIRAPSPGCRRSRASACRRPCRRRW